MFKLNHISVTVAQKMATILKRLGTPTENRVLILSPKDQDMKVGEFIIPGQTKEGVPREGVVIYSGPITDDYNNYLGMINTGVIVTYGLYAGKELDLWKDFNGTELASMEGKWEFTVLALNEIIYVHENKDK